MKNTAVIEAAMPALKRAITHLEQFERRSKQLHDPSAAYYQMCAVTALELLGDTPEAFFGQMPLSMVMAELVENLQIARRLADNRAREFPVLDSLLCRLIPSTTRPATK